MWIIKGVDEMKREYVKPVMMGEAFVANEYVASCWSVNCNVPSGVGYYEKNGKPGYQIPSFWDQGDKIIARGSGCGTEHVASGLDGEPTANAMWEEYGSGDVYAVFHWKAYVHGAKSDHFSKVSDADWAPNPNAS